MKTIIAAAVVAATSLVPSLGSAQISAEFRVNLPVVLPPLVVIQPGVQVVPDVEEEVFFSDGYYWVRRDGRWWRSRSHRGGWILVGPRYVPARLVNIPPGHYKHWHPGRGPAPAAYKEERKERKERWKEEKREMKEERKEAKERGKGRGRDRD